MNPETKIPVTHRTLKCTIPIEEFGLAQWAAKRTMRTLPNGKLACVPLADYFRLALIEKATAVVMDEIKRGKPIPPDIARTVDRKIPPAF